MNKWGLYEWSVILFFLLLPLAAILIESLWIGSTLSLSALTLKWLVFSGVGLRLGSAGIKQVIQPSFTAREIFRIETKEMLPLVRELGFANICLGALGLISLFIHGFRIPGAVAGGLYFGLAGIQHLVKKRESPEEVFAMASDLYMFISLWVLLVLSAL